MKIKLIKEFHVQPEQGESFKLPAGTLLESNGKIVNNGTPFLAYECVYQGKKVFVKPLIGYVEVE
jgi:hypothetical protein